MEISLVQANLTHTNTPPGVHGGDRDHTSPGKPVRDQKSGDQETAVVITLSLTATEILAADDSAGDVLEESVSLAAIPGKSVAHRARQSLDEDAFLALRDLPFGKIVSALARNLDLASLLPPPIVEESPEGEESKPPEQDAVVQDAVSSQQGPQDVADTDDGAIALTLLEGIAEPDEATIALALLEEATQSDE